MGRQEPLSLFSLKWVKVDVSKTEKVTVLSQHYSFDLDLCSFILFPKLEPFLRCIPQKSIFILPDKRASQIIRIFHECEVHSEKSIPRVTIRHHEACRVMLNSYPGERIFTVHQISKTDSFFLDIF